MRERKIDRDKNEKRRRRRHDECDSEGSEKQKSNKIEGNIMPKINTMETPKVVSLREWEAARQQLLVKEKELTRARDAMAAARRRMQWRCVAKKKELYGPKH